MNLTSGCPDDQHLAALVDGTLSDQDRAVVSTHVEGCLRCLDLVAALGTLSTETVPPVEERLKERVRATRSRWTRVAPVLAAAALLVVVVRWWAPGAPPTAPAIPRAVTVPPPAASSDVERARPAALVSVEEPQDDAVLSRHPVVRWTAPAQAVAFEVQVATPTGDVIWSRQVDGSVRSTTVDADLPRGIPCYVWVAAYLPEGRRVPSGVVKVRTAAGP